jgi:hypothetical protein
VIKQSVRSAIKPTVKQVATDDRVKRNFVSLDSGSVGHFILGSAWESSTAGNIIEFTFKAPSSTVATSQYLLDGSGVGNRFFLILNPDGSLDTQGVNYMSKLYLDGVSVDRVNSTYPTDGKLHKYKAVLKALASNVQYIGARYTVAESFNGIISDLRLIDVGDPTNTRRFLLNKLTGNTETSALGEGEIAYTNVSESDREGYFWDNGNSRWEALDGSPTVEVA